MKVKSVYLAVGVVVLLALYLLINPPAPEFVSKNQVDVVRFGPDSLDVQMGMGTFRWDAPNVFAAKPEIKPLLLFPPSREDLERLSGPAVSV
jgi:hypothetical protein